MLAGDVSIRVENDNPLRYRVTVGDFARLRERPPELPEDLGRFLLHATVELAAVPTFLGGELWS